MRDMRWTDEQAEAIAADGHLLLTASAGTGKTTTVVGKILWRLGLEVGARKSDGAPIRPCPDPCRLDEIAAVTFTEKAAHDLKAKLRSAIEASERGHALRWEVDRAAVGTIHGFCAEILREHALRLGIDPTFRVLDEREARLRLDEIIRDLLFERLSGGDPPTAALVKRHGLYGWGYRSGAIGRVREALRDVRWRASRYEAWCENGRLSAERLARRAREAGCWPEGGEEEEQEVRALEATAALHELAVEAKAAWSAWLEEENARDFDSLVLDARRLLTGASTRAALEGVRRRFRLLVVDEFQDTDAAQRDIAFAIAGLAAGDDVAGELGPDAAEGDAVETGSGPSLFLVGDPKQSIYRFRGADISVWNAVARTMERRGRRLELTANFRSEPRVVRFVNRVGGHALEERAEALASESPESRVRYRAAAPARPDTPVGVVEWLAVEASGRKEERRRAEARALAARLLALRREGARATDPDGGAPRPLSWRDCAVLARTRAALAEVEAALREHGIPCYNTATSGLSARQEVIDLITVLRLLDNPHDDLRAAAFLRSPFVGLRDEVLARIRLDRATGGGSLLRQARRWLDGVETGSIEPFPAPEGERIEAVEREALERGLAALEEGRALVDRADAADLLEEVLVRTGYRLHLLLRSAPREALANTERLLSLLEDYGHLPLGSFLELWDRWGEQDLGLPQAPLYSEADDVVTLSTIHSAKGLEWPVVLFIGTDEGPDSGPSGLSGSYWSDPELGPALMPVKDERGPRCALLFERAVLEDGAEEARLLYVALTRARDRVVLVGPAEAGSGYGAWLGVALDSSVEAGSEPEPGRPPEGDGYGAGRGARPRASAPDAATGTGRQIDAFGFDDEPENGDGQFSLFAVPAAPGGEAAPGAPPEAGASEPGWADPGASPDGESAAEAPLVVVRRVEAGGIQTRLGDPPVALDWMEDIVPAEPPGLIRPVARPPFPFLSSATELRLRERDPRAWSLRYEHGVALPERFAPAPSAAAEGGVPPEVRGQLIHGVLERIEEEREIARVLNEAIAEIGAPELEALLDRDAPYRRALEREIVRVVRSPEWAWYVEGAHWRELSFVHLVGPREWRIGAFDLYRSAEPALPGRVREKLREAGATGAADWDGKWIVDFKTHAIEAAEAAGVAAGYAVQAAVYAEAAAALGGPARVLFHFTAPNVTVAAEPDGAPAPSGSGA